MATTIHRPRHRLASLVVGALMLAGFAVATPALSASAAQCTLGPSIGAVARAAGVSCPDNIGGDGSDPRWGAAGSACKFSWDNSTLPDGFLSYLSLGTSTVSTYEFRPGHSISRSIVMKGGKAIGAISIETLEDHTFVMGINVYGREGIKHEFAYFDCAASSDGPMYQVHEASFAPMPEPGSGSVPAGVKGKIQTRGALTAADGGKYLLRLDLTNTGTAANIVDLHLGLAGYSIDSFPLISSQMTCSPNDGLGCSLEWIAPGQTVSTWILLNVDGTANPTVDVDVMNMGFERVSTNLGKAPVNHPTDVLNFYQVTRS